jgi:hypothetical protein
MNATHFGSCLAQPSALSGVPARPLSTARCMQIARECLEADPFRYVPHLELEIDRLALAMQGRELTAAAIREVDGMNLPAYQVAVNALQLVDESVST